MSYIKGQQFMVNVNGKRLIIREQMLRAIEAYIDHGKPVGSFLFAVISNNLREAFNRADEDNLENLHAFIQFFIWEAPSGCWGSPDKYGAWCDKGGLEGK